MKKRLFFIRLERTQGERKILSKKSITRGIRLMIEKFPLTFRRGVPQLIDRKFARAVFIAQEKIN
jgi:hypothetical protein